MFGARKIPRRSTGELDSMRAAGAVVAQMHAAIREAMLPGVTLAELDTIARDVLADNGATSNFLNYHGFPAVICASVNEVVVHGIPGPQALTHGDIISIDCGAIIDGWHGDAAFTAGVGEIDAESQLLIDVTDACLAAAMDVMRPGAHLSDIGAAVQLTAEAAGMGVVRDYTGHGIGRSMHEEPSIPNFGVPGKGPVLEAGNTLCVEPMVTLGDPN